MSTVDIVVISPEVFYTRRSSTYAISEPIHEVVKSIFSCECFNEQKCIEIYNSQYKQKTFVRNTHTHTQSPRTYNTNHIRSPKTRKLLGDKTEKEIMACLNVLNKSNRHIVQPKVARIFQLHTDPRKLIRFVLEKAVSNTPYMYMYMDIISNLPPTSSVPQSMCAEVKKEFSDEFVENIKTKFSELSATDYNDVDGFCVFNKLKLLILNSHNGIIYMETVDLVEYFKTVTALFDTFKQKHIIDVIVTMTCILIDKSNNKTMLSQFKEMCNRQDFIDSCCTKTLFTLERFK